MSVVFEILGHREWAAMCDVARAFFGDVNKNGTGLYEAPFDRPLHVISEVTPPIGVAKAREASRSGFSETTIHVSTSIFAVAENGERKLLEQIDEQVALHDIRRVLKRQLYVVLSAATGILFPWGSLTGVRPTQIALDVLQRVDEQKATEELEGYWRLSSQKARLAVRTALAEEKILDKIQEHESMLYVGLPFCPSRCLYCSFITQDATRQKNALEAYVNAVIRESEGVFDGTFQGKIRAVYYGGGTPTSLPADLFRRYLEEVLQYVPLAENAEKTMEAGRPDTIDREKLLIAKAFGFHKLCINPQAMHDETLRRIGRHHTVEQTIRAFHLARSMGFSDINMDLIAGLPGEDSDTFLNSLERVIALGPESITLHALAIKRGSFLDRMFDDRDTLLPDPFLIEAVEAAHERLRQEGYRPYYLYRQKNCRSGLENTGFTREGHASLYNVAMMSDRVPVIGLGSGASSKVIREQTALRVHNPKDIKLYIDRVEEQILKKKTLLANP